MNNETFFVLGVLARCFVILILCFGAIGKLINFDQFSEGLVISMAWPEKFVKSIGIGLITLESGLAILLTFKGFLYEFALLSSAMLFSVFFIFITSVVLKNKIVTCNCFGKGEQKLSLIDSIRNLLLIAAILLIYFIDIFSSIYVELSHLVYAFILLCALNLVILTIYIKEVIRIVKFNPEAKYYG